MTVKTFRLPNGVACVCEERPKTGRVAMQIQIKSGSAHEPPEENGLTFLTQEATLGGVAERKLIEDCVESTGGSFSHWAGKESTIFQAFSLARHAEDTFAYLAGLIRSPALEGADIRMAKSQVENMIGKEGEKPEKKTHAKFHEAAFSGQPIGSPSMGAMELLESFTPSQVRRMHAELFSNAEKIVVSFAGDIGAAEAEKLVQECFGDLPAGKAVEKPQTTFIGGDYREAADNNRLNLEFGFGAPSRHAPDKYMAMLLEEVLSGGQSSPLFQEIREKRGMVYDVRADYVQFETSGSFSIMAGTGKENAGKIITVSLDLLGEIVRKGVDATALEQSRKQIIRKTRELCETAEGACLRNITHMLFFGRVTSLEEVEFRLGQVTSDDLRRVCADMLRDGKYALAAIGPQETMPSAQEIKDMMQTQFAGVVIPTRKESIAAPFNFAAGKPEIDDAPSAEPKMTVLKNGIKVLTVERPGTLSCCVRVGAGSDNETPASNGIFHIIEHDVSKGTSSYAPGQIDRIIEGQLGGRENADTSNDATQYQVFNLEANALEKAVDILGEMVFKAIFDRKEFDGETFKDKGDIAVKGRGERGVVIDEIRRKGEDIAVHRMNLLMGTAYPDQPHGRPVIGIETTVRAMTVEKLTAVRDQFYVPNNVVFCAAGPVRHEDVVALVESKYGRLPPKDFPPLPVPVYRGGTSFIETKAAGLCHVVLAAEAVSCSDSDNLAYDALGIILGKNAGNISYRNGGMFSVAGAGRAEEIRPFVDYVYTKIQNIAVGLTQSDLDKVKATMEMRMLHGLETNRDACTVHASNALAYGRLVTQEELAERIQNLTVDDIKRVAGKVLQSNPTFAMVVPEGTDRRHLPTHDEVLALRDGTPPAPAALNMTGRGSSAAPVSAPGRG
ncbi:MAG: pitrilysin family protein [Pseudomonadota bacterium]